MYLLCCHTGRLVRQRHPAAESENETVAPYSTKIPVIYPPRRRATRRRSAYSSVDNTSATSRCPDDECDNVSQSSSSSAANKHETTASSWCPSSLWSDDQSPHPSQATDDLASSTTIRVSGHHNHFHNSNLFAVPSAGRHSACPTTSRLVLGALNVHSLNNKVNAVRDLFNSRKIDVVCRMPM